MFPEIHKGGVTSFSWGPALPPINFQEDFDNLYSKENNAMPSNYLPMRIVTCGGDGLLKIIEFEKNESISVTDIDKFANAMPIDVAWLNYVGYSEDVIAICCSDKTVNFMKKESGESWTDRDIDPIKLDEDAAKVCWSHCGAYLGVTMRNNKIRIFQENLDDTWEEVEVNQKNINPMMQMNNKMNF